MLLNEKKTKSKLRSVHVIAFLNHPFLFVWQLDLKLQGALEIVGTCLSLKRHPDVVNKRINNTRQEQAQMS